MPQTSPMNWIFLIWIPSLLLMNSYSFFPSSFNNSVKSLLLMKTTNWMW